MELDPQQQDNRANWSDRARVHAVSDDYGLSRFSDDPEFISSIIAYDAPLVGDLAGLSVVHLQCHIGTDTVSLARSGAAEMAGLDFSDAARKLSQDCGTPVDFVVGNVHDAPATFGRTLSPKPTVLSDIFVRFAANTSDRSGWLRLWNWVFSRLLRDRLVRLPLGGAPHQSLEELRRCR